ncbi:alpha/beta hydrolase [Microbacterium sp. NPDC058389]|uniref:alpha/beta hydrolase n=1 Tax=Microbacterium sp. NPDC058389 TaxID=3346475 RepID=UPI0036516266
MSIGEGNRGRVRMRWYRPRAGTVRPPIVRVQGGSFWNGSIDQLEVRATGVRRAIAVGATVVDVDYRLAPGDPSAEAIENVESAVNWALLHVDDHHKGRGVLLEGVSTGAPLAAATALRFRDRGEGAIVGILLAAPTLDLRSDSATKLDLRDFPPTHVMVADADEFRGAGVTFVHALRGAGVSVTASRHLGLAHDAHAYTGKWRGARLWQHESNAALIELADDALRTEVDPA